MPREETLVQKSIVDVLRLCGLTVLHTSAFSARGRLGTAKGVPDLLCFAPDAPQLIVGLEVKTASGRPTKEQQALADAGMYRIVRSPEEALEAVREALERYAPGCRTSRRIGAVVLEMERSSGSRR